MIVTFNPFAGSSADVYGAFANFLRCVQAVATANANTTSITVNPMLANTGAMDMAKNCIISIDANTDAGGWSVCTDSTVPQPNVAWTGVNSPAAWQNKLELFRPSGKSSKPYYRIAVHGHSGVYSKTPGANNLGANWTNVLPAISFSMGANSANTTADVSHLPQGATWSGQGTQTNGWTVSTQHNPTTSYYNIPFKPIILIRIT